MRSVSQAVHLDIGGNEEVGTFGIKTTGKAFRLLIDGLYSDKIQSIVREVSANAYDAHLQAKNKKPIYVHTPTFVTPQFYVRDFGNGMSHVKVMTVFTTMFDSDKDGDNELVGQFGLGSKSPFAYTDQFDVSCYDGTTVRHYGAAIGPGGIPQIILRKTQPCDEPSGVRVGFAVEDKDFEKFETAVRKISFGFDPVFDTNCTGLGKLGTILFEGDGWSTHESGASDAWLVRQGCVVYPITSSNGVNLPSSGWSNRFRHLIDCPIGTIEVTASREQIAYTPAVVEYLQKRIDAAVAEMPIQIEKKLRKVQNVSQFFSRLDQLCPAFIPKKDFTHPFTGLASPTAPIPHPGAGFQVSYDPDKDRWTTYNDPVVCASAVPVDYAVYEITDAEALLAKDREPNAELSDKEYRKLSRLLRLWAEKEEKKSVRVWINSSWTDQYIECLLPGLIRIPLPASDLLGIVPTKRVGAVMRGVSIIHTDLNKSGAPKPVKTLDVTENVAWISAAQFQRSDVQMRKIASRFAIDNLYVATSNAYKTLETSAIPTLREAIEAKLASAHSMSWDDYVTLSDVLGTYSYYTNQMIKLLKRAEIVAPDALAKLQRSKTAIGDYARLIHPYIYSAHLLLNAVEQQALGILNEIPNKFKQRKLQPTKPVKTLVALYKLFEHERNTPAPLHFLSAAENVNPDDLSAYVNALISVSRLMPISRKIKPETTTKEDDE